MARRILITGASNAAAWWLGRHGFNVTAVERDPAFRDGGQDVDVRGVGREVLRRMGLKGVALGAGTGETGTAWMDTAGHAKARFIAAELGAGVVALGLSGLLVEARGVASSVA